MKISKSKQELARIISENGGWRERGKFATQDKGDFKIGFWNCKERPVRERDTWKGDGWLGTINAIPCYELLPDWHQCILSREEYFHLYPAPDADGWIEWDGKPTSPVMHEIPVDLKLRNGRIEKCQIIKYDDTWGHDGGGLDIIAYRLHKPEQAEPEFCESVMRSIPEHSEKPTIEQLAADYRNAKDYADRKQQEADEAKADADAKLVGLVAAGKALNLVISVTEEEPELVITDLLDLRVGDRIWIGDSGSKLNCPEGEYEIVEIDNEDQDQCVGVEWDETICWPQLRKRNWKFIHRP